MSAKRLKTMICVRLPVAHLRRLRALAKRQERPMTEVLREAVGRYLRVVNAAPPDEGSGALKAVCTYLEPEQHEALALIAAKLGVAAAVLVREAVRRAVAAADYMKADDVRVAKAESERDELAAVLAEVREAALWWDRWCMAHHGDAYGNDVTRGPKLRLDRALAALPAELAAERDRRVRAEALAAAARLCRDEVSAHVRDGHEEMAAAALGCANEIELHVEGHR